MDSTLQLQSKYGKGSTFYFEIKIPSVNTNIQKRLREIGPTSDDEGSGEISIDTISLQLALKSLPQTIQL